MKKYYETEDFCPQKNELLLENTLLFQLWQQLGDNGNVIRSLFRSKCFAMNVIDDNFRDRLYKNARRIEAYSSNFDVKDSIIDNPNLENELYANAIKEDKIFDEMYISLTLENKITDEKKKFREEIQQKDKKIEEERVSKNEMSSQIRKLTQYVDEQSKEHEQNMDIAVSKTRIEERNAAIDRLAKNLRKKKIEKIKVFLLKIFVKDFNEEKYFLAKAENFLGETE